MPAEVYLIILSFALGFSYGYDWGRDTEKDRQWRHYENKQ